MSGECVWMDSAVQVCWYWRLCRIVRARWWRWGEWVGVRGEEKEERKSVSWRADCWGVKALEVNIVGVV